MAEGEFEFIARRLRPLAAGCDAALDLLDDAAVLDPPSDRELVLTEDAMVEGVHFLPDDPPAQVAQKLLRVNLSDLAAMGADGLGYLLAIARPATLADDWLPGFCEGLAEDQAEFAVHLLGGDTVSTPGPLTLCLTALGTVPRGKALRRSGAMADDDLYVSGTLGDAALGLQALQGTLAPGAAATLFLADRYRRPHPRLALGAALRDVAHAAIDVSDGLLADLGHVVEASGVGAEVWADALPLSVAARDLVGVLDAALSGGDDYELLFAAPPACRAAIEQIGRHLALPLTPIGRIEAAPGVRVIDAAGRPLSPRRTGWRHF